MSKGKNVLQACQEAYNKGRGGNVQAAIKVAESRGYNDYRYCTGCDASMPVTKGNITVQGEQVEVCSCLICGSSIN